MKILLCALYYAPAWAYGGPPKMASDLGRHLARRGHEVTVCTTDAFDAHARLPVGTTEIEGVRVVRFRNASNSLAWRLKIFLPIGMHQWLDENAHAFDIVHLFDARTMLNAWAAHAATAAHVPFVLSVWGSLPRGDGWRAIIKARYDNRYAKMLLGGAAALLAQNDHEAELYKSYGAKPGRIVLWPLGVDPDEFGSLPARGQLRERLGIKSDAPMALFVGRINILKGLHPLIRAFARADVTRAHLVIVGRDDGYLSAAKTIARNEGVAQRVHFPGPLYGSDVAVAYVDCDLFCITPTHYEETSLASLCAAACGRPILINDRCGLPWLDEFDAGICVRHDEAVIAQAMHLLLTDDSRRTRMGLNARRMVEERFFVPRIVDQLEKIYDHARTHAAGPMAFNR